MVVRAKKRFIAGAVCPSCNQMDTVVVYLEDEQSVRECVRCGYRDAASWDEPAAAGLPTRVDRAPVGNDVQVVRIVEPGDGRKH